MIATYRAFPGTVRLLFAGMALVSTGNGALYPFLGLYVTERFDVDVAVAGIVSSAFFVTSAIGSPIAGALADRFGRRPVILATLVLESIGIGFLGLAPEIGFVVLAVVFAGLFGAGAYPVIQAIVADTIPEEQRSVVYGSMYQALGLGWFLGPVIAAPVIGTLGYGAVFAIAFGVILLAAVLLAVRLPETLRRPAPGPGAKRAVEAGRPETGNLPLATAGEAVEVHEASLLGDVGKPTSGSWFRDRRLLLYVGLHLMTFGAYIQLFNIFPIDGRDRLGLAPETWAAILAVNGAMILLGQGIVSLAVRRFHRPYVVAAGVLVWAAGFVALGLVPSATFVLPAVMLLTIGEMIVFPIQPAVVADLAPASMRGRYQGALTMGGSLGNAIGPAIAGFAVAAIGGGWWLVLGAFLVGLSAAYVAFGMRVLGRTVQART